MTKRVVILGIGNRLRGDDAIGSIAGELLAAEGLPAIDCSVAPENFLTRVIDMRPTELLLIDSCDFAGDPGEIRVFEETEFERIAYGLLLTHTLPLTLLAALIKKETNCRIRLIGIQPLTIEFGTELSEPISRALPKVIALAHELATTPSLNGQSKTG